MFSVSCEFPNRSRMACALCIWEFCARNWFNSQHAVAVLMGELRRWQDPGLRLSLVGLSQLMRAEFCLNSADSKVAFFEKRSAYAPACTPTFFQRVDVLLPSEGQFVGSWFLGSRVLANGMLRGRDTMSTSAGRYSLSIKGRASTKIVLQVKPISEIHHLWD